MHSVRLSILTGLFLLFSIFIQAQDTIALKIGAKIPAKNINIISDTLHYQIPGDRNASRISKIRLVEVSYIRYADGTFVSYLPKMKPQYRQIMLKAGANYSQEMGPFQIFRELLGFQGGLGYVSKKKGKKQRIGLEAELGFAQRGGWVVANNVPVYDNKGNFVESYYGNYAFHLNYLQGNCIARYYLHPMFYIKAGLGLGYLQGYKGLTMVDVNNPDLNSDIYKKSDFKSVSAGLLYGFGIQTNSKKVGALLEFVGQNDFTALGIQSPDGLNYKNNTFYVNVGMFINLY